MARNLTPEQQARRDAQMERMREEEEQLRQRQADAEALVRAALIGLSEVIGHWGYDKAAARALTLRFAAEVLA